MPAAITRMLAVGLDVARAEAWLLVHGRLTLVGSHPPGADDSRPPGLLDGAADSGHLRSVTVAHDGRPLGVLRVQERDGHRLTSVEERLFGGLAAQAGLVLQTAQLRAELSETLNALSTRQQQLRRARDALVVTQDIERRRLERDIHDGAQQQLVALTINLKLVKAVLDTDPRQALAVLDEQVLATRDAIATLSDLSHGLLPGLLGERGVAHALVDVTSGNPIPVRVEASGVDRLPAAVEAAVYFCSLEAVQNATKHEQASAIDVRLEREADRVVLTVEDDGVGMPTGTDATTREGPAAGPRSGIGSGLDNMRHRIGSVGGHVTITPGASRGTTVTAVLPVGAADAAWRS
jgi:signal transduction histidine kinase